MNTFNRVAASIGNRFKNSPIIILFFILSVALQAICISLNIEDISTSYWGYQMFPTEKVNPQLVGTAIAFLPSVAQAVLLYAFLDNPRRRLALIGSILFAITDVIADMYFKTGGFKHDILLALGESVVFFSIGSEVLGTMAFGLIVSTAPYAIAQIKAMGLGGSLLETFVYDDRGEETPNLDRIARALGNGASARIATPQNPPMVAHGKDRGKEQPRPQAHAPAGKPSTHGKMPPLPPSLLSALMDDDEEESGREYRP